MYQESDKQLVATYITECLIPKHYATWHGNGVLACHLDMPFPAWMELRKALYDDAVAWKQSENEKAGVTA